MKFGAAAILTLNVVLAIVLAAPIVKHAAPIVPGTQFDHFFILVLENADYAEAAANDYFTALAAKGVLLTDMYATTHPSQPNYIAMISGSTQGLTDNLNHSYKAKNIVDLLEAKGISWKSYQENFPGNCYLSDSSNSFYRRKHNPFISFSSISTNPTRCAKIVNSNQLNTDIANGNLPQFSFYTPNMRNNGHDTTLSFSAGWLKKFLEPKLTDPAFMKNTVILITFDEEDTKSLNTNRVYSILLGDAVHAPPGTVDRSKYTHYSILATLENNWNLGNLGQHDVDAVPFNHLG